MTSAKPVLVIIHALFLITAPRHLVICLICQIRVAALGIYILLCLLHLLGSVINSIWVYFAFLNVDLLLIEGLFFYVFIRFNLVC